MLLVTPQIVIQAGRPLTTRLTQDYTTILTQLNPDEMLFATYQWLDPQNIHRPRAEYIRTEDLYENLQNLTQHTPQIYSQVALFAVPEPIVAEWLDCQSQDRHDIRTKRNSAQQQPPRSIIKERTRIKGVSSG